MCSEPLGFCFAGGVAVVFWCLALEVQRDVALLLAIRSCGFDGVHLLAITEWDLNPEGAVGGKRNFLTPDREACGRIRGAVDDQLSVSNQPEGALTGGDSTSST